MNPVVLRDYQGLSIDGLRAGIRAGHRLQVLAAPAGSGKCLATGTMVMLSSGVTVPVESVRVGDRLMGPDGTPRNVLSVASGFGPMYRITPVKGEAYEVNDAHILSLKANNGTHGIRLSDGTHVPRGADVVNVNVEVLARSGRTARGCLKGWRAERIAEFEQPPQPLPIPAYILGAWLGDGTSNAIALSKPECNMVREWKAYGESMGMRVHTYHQPGKCQSVYLSRMGPGSDNPARSLWRSAGLFDKKHIPAAYLFAPAEVRAELLAGMIDSDGHIHKGGCDWVCKDKTLADQFVFLCRSLGLACYLSEQRKGIKSTGFSAMYWRASVSGDLSTIPMRDKKALPRKQIKRHNVTGVSVTRIPDGSWHGFEIDGDKLFLLGDFTVTHNTECAAYLVSECHARGRRALFIVDRINLVDQTSERFDRYGIPHGIIQAGHWRMRLHERVQIASAQTLERRGIPEDFDLVIVDECHCMRRQITDYLQRISSKVIGLTATPFTKGMAKVYQSVVNVTTTDKLIESGNLVPLKVYAGKRADMTGAKVVAGEWRESDIEERSAAIIGDIVAEWTDKTHKHFGGPVKTIVFSATVAHGTELLKQFQEAGHRFEQISYQTGDDDYRRQVIEEFRRPDSQIVGLIACEVFTKGFDVPDVMCGISARPYRKSLSSHIQQVGRVQRPAPGKEFGLWLCHSGNYLSFQDDVDEVFSVGVHELDDGKREDAAAKRDNNEADRKECKCKACGFIMPASALRCPACGAVRVRASNVETVKGEMVEVQAKLKGELAKMSKASLWRQISQWALDKKAGDQVAARRLALAKYKDWNGCWPRSEFGEFEPVSIEVARKIQADNIKWAKRR